MSTGIRPPSGPSAAGSATSGAAGVDGPSEVSSSAPAEIGRADATRAVASSELQQVDSPMAAVLSRLDAGEITREQAIESLVADALTAHGGARLPQAQRSELEGLLRAALLEDPTLSQLLG